MSGRTGATSVGAVALAVTLALAACGGAGNSPAPSSPGGPAPTGASIDGGALAASFVEILADPTLHADVVQQATATADQAGDPLEFRVTMGGVLALPDVNLELVVEAEGQSTRFGLIVAGNRSFVDLGEGWQEAPAGSVDSTELTGAFVVVSDPNDLEYVGSQEIAGRTLYHLVTTGPLPYTPAGFEGTGTGTMTDLDAYVEADGTPVRIELSFTASGGTAASAMDVAGTTEIRFSNVGGSQQVVAPSLAPSAAPTAVPTAVPSGSASAAPSTTPSPTP